MLLKLELLGLHVSAALVAQRERGMNAQAYSIYLKEVFKNGWKTELSRNPVFGTKKTGKQNDILSTLS